MSAFGAVSQRRLRECSMDLQLLFSEVVKGFDCSVLVGHRGEAEQNAAFEAKKSTKRWPESKHNTTPSLAVDVAPYPIDWDDLDRFYYFAGYVKGRAESMDIRIRWGGDWDGDTDLHDQQLMDLVHFELVR